MVAAFFSEMNHENNSCGCFCFYKKTKFSQKHLWQNPFLRMIAKVCSQQFYLKRLHHRCYAVNFAKLSRTSLSDTPLNGCLRFQTSLENGTCVINRGCVFLQLYLVYVLRPATLLKKRLWYRCFPVNFAKFLRTPFVTKNLRWLLLRIINSL